MLHQDVHQHLPRSRQIYPSSLSTHLVSKFFIQFGGDSFSKINSKMPRFYPNSIFHFSEDEHFAEQEHIVTRRSSSIAFWLEKTGTQFSVNARQTLKSGSHV